MLCEIWSLLSFWCIHAPCFPHLRGDNVACTCNVGWWERALPLYYNTGVYHYVIIHHVWIIDPCSTSLIPPCWLYVHKLIVCMKNSQTYSDSYSTHWQFILSLCWLPKHVNEIHSQSVVNAQGFISEVNDVNLSLCKVSCLYMGNFYLWCELITQYSLSECIEIQFCDEYSGFTFDTRT